MILWVTGCRWNFTVRVFFKCTFHMLSCRLVVIAGMLVSSGHQLEPYLYISLPDTGDRRHARIKFDDEVLSGRVCFFYYALT